MLTYFCYRSVCFLLGIHNNVIKLCLCRYSIVIFVQYTCSCMLHSTMSQRSYTCSFQLYVLELSNILFHDNLFDCHVVVAAAGRNTWPPRLNKQHSHSVGWDSWIVCLQCSVYHPIAWKKRMTIS